MLELSALVFAGLTAGAIHALSGPDHLAAVAPLTVANREDATKIGLLWGLGHAAGIAVIGVAVFLLRGFLDLEALSAWSERAVGLLLVAVGIWGLRKAFRNWFHTHEHKHGSETHTHVHFHQQTHDGADSYAGRSTHKHSHASLGIGLLHGVAGTSHFFGVLPALALPSTLAAVCYLCGYGLGNLLAMGGFGWLMGAVSGHAKRWGAFLSQVALGACSLISLAIGGIWLTG
jgi:ABC-type nickel/cobalt efflux system permease component RcnA